jgi:hypothetical protein
MDAWVTDENGTMLSIAEVRERLINDQPLVLCETANWNHENQQTKAYYLDYYMAKNLYYFVCKKFSRFNPESDYRPNPAEEDIRLIPVGFVNNNWKCDTTTDPNVFWAKPETQQADDIKNVVMNEGKKANAPSDVMAAVRAIASVYATYYDAYLKNVYPQVKADMEERRQLLSQEMEEHSFVKDWERVTGYTWHRGNYHWLLYRAGQKGPSYNNLNDSTNTVWYNQNIDYQLAMFSHEFGIFLMQDSIDPIVEEFKIYTRKLDSKRDLTYVPWSAFESLACWYNCKIAGRKTADYHAFGEADVKTFYEIFDRLSNDGISDPAELYRKGVKEYLKQLLWQ